MRVRIAQTVPLGSPWALYVPIRTTAGRPVNLTGFTATLVVKADYEAAALISLDETAGITLTSGGDATAEFTLEQVTLLAGYRFLEYDYQILDTAGTEVLWLSGILYPEASTL